MPLQKLVLPPDQAAYNVSYSKDALSVKLEGGRSRFRLDQLGGVALVNVQWSCNRDQYQYLRAFYNNVTVGASLPFLIDLYLDQPTLTEHESNFIPGSMRLDSQRGHRFVVSAQIEAKPIAADSEYDAAIIMLFEEYGSLEEAAATLSQLETLTNVDLPSSIGP